MTASLVVKGGDDDISPETRAVLAHPPTFILDAAELSSYGEQTPRPAALAVLRRVEPLEVLADDLVGRISLHALSTWIPARDVPVRRQQEDGIVDDALDQEPKEVGRVSLTSCLEPACANGASLHHHQS